MSDAVARVGLDAPMGMTDRTVEGIRSALAGKTNWRSPLLFAGPAVVASIAYMDPGNFATNIGAGARYGYALLWVVLTASIAAMLFQSLSAKLGIVTGRNLAELCREHFPKPVVWALWIVSEIAAMATDLAEFLGGAIGLSLSAAYPADRRHGRHGRPHLWHPDVRRPRVPPDRTHHRRARRRDRPLLSRRDGHRPSRLGARRGLAAWFPVCRTPAR